MVKHIIFLLLLNLFNLAPTTPQYSYRIQPVTPVSIQNFIHPDAGCQWDGLAGQVFDYNGQPVPELMIQIYGLYAGVPIYANVLTGISEKIGPGGFEYQLGSLPAATPSQLTIQVFTLSGEALSDTVSVYTGTTCESNLTIVNFLHVSNLYDVMLPLIEK